MVKISGVLGTLLMLFVTIHGLAEVTTSCTAVWLQVKVSRAPIVENLQPQPNELFLGYSCPVSFVEQDFFEFLYILSYCGITVHVYQLAILIESTITYDSAQLNYTCHIPVSCYHQRFFPIIAVMKQREETRCEYKRPVGQKCSISSELEHVGIQPGVLPWNSLLPLDHESCLPSCVV